MPSGAVPVSPVRSWLPLTQRLLSWLTAHGAHLLREASSGGLNRALEAGFAQLRQAGASRIAIVPADIPLLTGADLDRVLQSMETHRGHGPARRDRSLRLA